MRKLLSTVLLTMVAFWGNVLNAQTIIFEDFNSLNTIPSSWSLSSNLKISDYSKPGTCTILDKGLESPGVGPTAPIGMILPTFTFDAGNPYIVLNFKVFVYDANLKCNTAKDFPCSTFVEAYIVPSNWTDPLIIPAVGQYYAKLPRYQIVNANANNTVIFNNVALPDGVQYRILLNFKAVDSKCSSTGTKFVFDDFNLFKTDCEGSCAPVANNDYFNSDVQNFPMQLKGNVYGGYALWSSQAPSGFAINSLGYNPAVNNGTDYDLNNLNLNQMIFTQTGNLTIESSQNCPGSVSPGELDFNQDGTFTYTRGDQCVTRVSFYYTVKQNIPSGLESTPAKVIIDFSPLVVLPVHFQSFNAARNKDKKEQVILKWVTATEQNNRGFNVQRKVGSQWKNIAYVFSQAENGNSSTALAYEYKDMNVLNTVTQYQIQQVDYDGKTSYSDIKAVPGMEQKKAILIYPNPSVDGKINLLFSEIGSVKEVIVSDMNGRIVKQYRQVTENNLTIEGLLAGFYTIKITDRTSAVTTVEKVIIR